ncbi:hypothetical protein LTR91_025009 [Friedmanniomyces endolithicus]|uniref:Uncharacterized protein n=1 Tax=Friedmanniomyces endolithicus TaxID=329885 RepID=A0AAN6JZV2_9PEZI|nr:hypothetical protein LTR94_021419 [Friedmanniomyces endolithicus]KAK0771423.1 hypothetical protein LTR59_016110 [Friedmanniomyces endolithicus]KAK0771858.1 hypothetical protein LTR75_017568 [Friedmanniomyces endolithicus]KAK0772167.1 hypothetical protein LTR38_016974 [Friedmanniomyces endolithicus]KAK0890809.1 hypothetical protein LTR02_014457 [Friedmanniomyces endolithicus]
MGTHSDYQPVGVAQSPADDDQHEPALSTAASSFTVTSPDHRVSGFKLKLLLSLIALH